MQVAFLNDSISRKAGGVFEVQRRLAQNLIEIPGVSIKIFGSRDEHTQDDLELWSPFKPIVQKKIGPSAFSFSPTLVDSLKNSGSQIIHLHVLWLYQSIASIRSGLPYVTTIHGMLDNWALNNSRLKKKIVGALYEKAALNKANCLQAFTWQEYNDIRSFGIKSPVCMIPNGVDVPKNFEELKSLPPVWDGQIEEGKKVLLYLGRIHPKKGLTNLVKAWKEAQSSLGSRPDWVLAIVGWDQGGYENELKQLANELGISESILFLGPQFNQQKELCFAHADAFILPSFSEGLPMAVLEAWAYDLPVLMTKQCNLPEGFEVGAAMQIDSTEKSIKEGLIELFSLPQKELTDMGAKGKELVIQKFTWKKVAQEMCAVYKWVLNEGPLPSNVILK